MGGEQILRLGEEQTESPKGKERHKASFSYMITNLTPNAQKCPKVMILLNVFEGPSRIRGYLQIKTLHRKPNVTTDRSRALYQHRKNPYS